MWSWLLQTWRRVTAAIRWRHLERDIDDELAFHVAMRQQRLIADGVAAEDAGHEARRRFGNVTAVKEEMREMWTFPSVESIWQDALYAVRNLRQQRGFTATVVLVLASVIGLNTTAFTVVAGIALRPWPGMADPSRVVRLYLADPSGHTAGFSIADARGLAAGAPTLAGVGIMKNESVRVGTGDAVATSEALMVNGTFFDVLGVHMAHGRGFLDTEDRPGDPSAVAILSFAYWQRQFGSNPNVVGSTVRINDVLFSIVGVASGDFGSAEPSYDKQLFIPLSSFPLLKPGDATSEKFLYDRGACCVDVVARLSRDTTHAEARAQLGVLASGFRSFSGNVARGVVVTGTEFLSQPGRADSTQALVTGALLTSGLLLVWLLACANVGNLLLSRAAARVGEIATRLAIGASRWRIVRQLLIEGLVLALIASGLGVLVAYQLPFILFRVVADSGTLGFFPFSVTPDALVLGYAVLLAALSAIVFALAPALHTTRLDLVESLKRRSSLTTRRLPMRSVLLGVQVAVSVVLLVSAGLLIRGVQRLAGVFDPGFSVEDVTAVRFELPEGVYDRARATAFFEQLAESVRQQSIRAAAFASHEPFSRYRHGTVFHLSGESREQARQLLYLNVSPEYLTLLGIPLRSGRNFEAADVRRPVVLVNETMAKRFWPGDDAVGKTFFIRPRGPVNTMEAREIVGVVQDVKTSIAGSAAPLFYQPIVAGEDVLNFISRDPRASQPPTLLLKTSQDLSGEIARIAAGLDPRVRVYATPLSASVDAMMKTAQWGPILAATLGLFALGLATVGVFGVFGYAVRQQRREIGIRMALGAAPAAIVGLLFTHYARALIGGLAVGLAGSIAASVVLRHRLHGLSPFDPVAYLTVAALLACAGLAATVVPARAATRVDPSQTLREI
jgi:predicted permease